MAGTDYVVNPLDSTSPLDTNVARKGAAELRAMKARINAIALGAAGNQAQVRQTVLQGLLTAAGIPSMLVASATALGMDLKATTLAVILAYSAGFTAQGNADAIEQVIADQVNYWALLPVSNTSYLGITRVGAGALTPFQTLAPPQYGDIYDQGKQSVLQFSGAAGSVVFLDDFGNTWTAQGGAKIQTNNIKFGTGALGGAGATNALNGVADYIKSTSITSVGLFGWSIRCWATPLNALPGVGAQFAIMQFGNAATFGATLGIQNTGGVIKFAYWLSSNGTAFDLASAVQGTTTPVLGTTYFIELTFDALSGNYRLYINGAQESATATTVRLCNFTSLTIGANSIGTNLFQGYVDKPEFLPYCQHPAGTAYAVPTAAPNIALLNYASDWFDTQQMIMKTITGASVTAGVNPTFIQSYKLYVGEGDTGAAAISASRTYAYRGKYQSVDIQLPGIGTVNNFADNLGVPYKKVNSYIRCRATENGYVQGQILPYLPNAAGALTGNSFNIKDRNTSIVTIGSNSPDLMINQNTGVVAAATSANWGLFVTAERTF